MRNLFEMIYEYQHLRGRERLEVPLEDDERTKLYGLGQLLRGEIQDRQREMVRMPYPTGVQFTMPDGFGVGAVKNISGNGIAIATRQPLFVGARTVTRVEESDVEYFFPCRVCWSRTSHNPGMGLVFDGMPSQAFVFGDEGSGVRWSSLRLGDGKAPTRVA